MAIFNKGKKEELFFDDVIVEERRVSVSELKKAATQANKSFWSLVVSLALVFSMVVPYLSFAATGPSIATDKSAVFTGEIIPGYSMGGIELKAYGIDLNKWAKSKVAKGDAFVGSNYGVWSGKRLSSAVNNLKSGEKLDGTEIELFVQFDENKSANYNLTEQDKALGWQAVTGKNQYSARTKDGMEGTNKANRTDATSPYRTYNDFNYWNAQNPTSSDTAPANITVSLCADFIIVGIKDNKATILTSPDSIDNDSSSMTENDSCVPYYIPLKDLFDRYGLNDSKEASITALLEKIDQDSNASTTLADLAKNKGKDLLKGTNYTGGNEASDAFNPYPYTMVFSKDEKNGRVVSSMYENCEAYVYFSPYSVYTQYLALKQEYDKLMTSSSTGINSDNGGNIVKMGYYLSTMSILEAYLTEALPQDMTRGYVGPTKTSDVEYALEHASSNNNSVGVKKTSVAKTVNTPALSQQSFSTDGRTNERPRPSEIGDRLRGRVLENKKQQWSQAFATLLQNKDKLSEDVYNQLYSEINGQLKIAQAMGTSGDPGFPSYNWDEIINGTQDTTGGENSGTSAGGGGSTTGGNSSGGSSGNSSGSSGDDSKKTLKPSGPTTLEDIYNQMEDRKKESTNTTSGRNTNLPSLANATEVAYSFLIYDLNNNHMDSISAIMNTLSVQDYQNKTTDAYGVMKGMNQEKVLNRATIYTPIDEGATDGIYTPVYHPIQQHKMPSSERAYRFQIMADIPYDSLVNHIKNDGFADNVSLSYDAAYSKADIKGLHTEKIDVLYDEIGYFAQKMNDAEETAANRFKLSDADREAIFGAGLTALKKDDLASDKAHTTYRVDSALSAYAQGTMNSDNVHDMLDIIRGTKNIKQETWWRYYNPIKSEGGMYDVYLARVSPALTIYMPSVLINGYTCAGYDTKESGDEIEFNKSLSPTACSHDYYSIPSLAPCLASHTASDCFYGVLNYELRAFYSKDFVNSLPVELNVPALEAYEAAQKAIDTLEQESLSEQGITWENIATQYVMAKRLAWLHAIKSVVNPSTISVDYLKERINDSTLDKVKDKTLPMSSFEYKQENNTVDTGFFLAAPFQGISNAVMSGSSLSNAAIVDNPRPSTIGNLNKDTSIAMQLEGVKPEKDQYIYTYREYSGRAETTGDITTSLTGNTRQEIHDTDQDDTVVEAPELSGTTTQYFLTSIEKAQWATVTYQAKDILVVLYKQQLDTLLGEGGSYEWVKLDDLAKDFESGKINTTAIKVGTGENQMFGVDFSSENDPWWQEQDSIETIISKYKEKFEETNAQISLAYANAYKDLILISQSVPEQMQNCLAWADYQNASDSEAQYYVDPSDANVDVNLNVIVEGQKETELASAGNAPKNIQELEKRLNKAGYSLTQSDSAEYAYEFQEADDGGTYDELQSKMIRGVEGSTWTYTQQPAEYTMVLSIYRTQELAETATLYYPYYGIMTSSFQQGTDRYASLQSHVIDYVSIASGIASDLSTRKRASLVEVDPDVAGIEGFLKSNNIIAGMLISAGKGFIKFGTDTFSKAYWDGAASVNTLESNGSTANAASNKLIQASLLNSAASYKYDWQTQELVYKNQPLVNSVYNSSSSVASAAGVTNWDTMFNNLLLHGGASFYAFIQTIALIILLVSLIMIAFSNFLFYSMGKEADIIHAQKTLKETLPKTVLAIFMIGLPPLSTGVGFEGGNFVLLRLLGNIINYIANIFISVDSSSVMGLWVNGFGFENMDIGMAFVYFLLALILMIMMLLATLCIIVVAVFISLFYLAGPFVWALWVWPKSNQNLVGPASLLSAFTGSGEQAGSNGFVTGYIKTYIATSAIFITWAMMFWIISLLFFGSGNFTYAGTSTAGAATHTTSMLLNTGYPQASAAILNLGMFGGDSAIMSMVSLVLALAMFGFMIASTKNMLFRTAQGMVGNAAVHFDNIRKNLQNARNNVQAMKGSTPNTSTETSPAIDDVSPAAKANTEAAKAHAKKMHDAQKSGDELPGAENKENKALAKESGDKSIARIHAAQAKSKEAEKENAKALEDGTPIANDNLLPEATEDKTDDKALEEGKIAKDEKDNKELSKAKDENTEDKEKDADALPSTTATVDGEEIEVEVLPAKEDGEQAERSVLTAKTEESSGEDTAEKAIEPAAAQSQNVDAEEKLIGAITSGVKSGIMEAVGELQEAQAALVQAENAEILEAETVETQEEPKVLESETQSDAHAVGAPMPTLTPDGDEKSDEETEQEIRAKRQRKTISPLDVANGKGFDAIAKQNENALRNAELNGEDSYTELVPELASAKEKGAIVGEYLRGELDQDESSREMMYNLAQSAVKHGDMGEAAAIALMALGGNQAEGQKMILEKEDKELAEEAKEATIIRVQELGESNGVDVAGLVTALENMPGSASIAGFAETMMSMTQNATNAIGEQQLELAHQAYEEMLNLQWFAQENQSLAAERMSQFMMDRYPALMSGDYDSSLQMIAEDALINRNALTLAMMSNDMCSQQVAEAMIGAGMSSVSPEVMDLVLQSSARNYANSDAWIDGMAQTVSEQVRAQSAAMQTAALAAGVQANTLKQAAAFGQAGIPISVDAIADFANQYPEQYAEIVGASFVSGDVDSFVGEMNRFMDDPDCRQAYSQYRDTVKMHREFEGLAQNSAMMTNVFTAQHRNKPAKNRIKQWFDDAAGVDEK